LAVALDWKKVKIDIKRALKKRDKKYNMDALQINQALSR
jgi:hypothetical protein